MGLKKNMPAYEEDHQEKRGHRTCTIDEVLVKPCFEEQKERLTIDEVVDRIVKRVSLKLVLVFVIAISCAYVSAAQILITVFTGFIPYDSWKCISPKCEDLLTAATQTENSSLSHFYSYETMCDNDLKAKIDFNWTSKRTTFSVEWGIYCDTEAKYSMVSSFYFIGACIGLAVSSCIFDRIGRKKGALIGAFVMILATAAGIVVPNFELMLALRVVQGFGQFMCWTGVYCWVVEFAPGRFRNIISALVLIGWSCGYLVIVMVAYYITNWRHIFLATAVTSVICAIPLFTFPESPRFHLVLGREREAKETLEKYSLICNNHISLDSIELIYEERVQSFVEQVKDFAKYPLMLKETLLCMVCWFIASTVFYSFSFGWSKIGKDLYTSYLLDAVGKTISMALTIPVCGQLGRKKGILFFLTIGVLSDAFAMPDLMLSENWSLEHVASLVGMMASAAAYGTLYLYTSELAPTSHRGMILSLSSSAARIGSFIGPYMRLLYDITDRRVPLMLFAAATGVMVVGVLFLPDTSGRRIPETPKDVEVVKMIGANGYRHIESTKLGNGTMA